MKKSLSICFAMITMFLLLFEGFSYGKQPSSIVVFPKDSITSDTVPAPWLGADIGDVAATGSATYNDGTFTVRGSGSNIYGNADEFHFVCQQITGDAIITAHIVSLTDPHVWTKGGVMMRDTLKSGSVNGHTFLAPISTNGSKFSYRPTFGAKSSEFDGPDITAPYWLRMQRVGDTLTGSVSPDGITWTVLGSKTIIMSSTYYVGLSVSSLADGTLATAVFDSVSIQLITTPVTGVTLSSETLTLTEGQTSNLTATIAPANATNDSVTWMSSNTSVATVDSNGLVTAVSAGSATITVTTNDGDYTANCAVTVNAPDTQTGVNSLNAKKSASAINVYPNPSVNGNVNIEISDYNGSSKVVLKVLDITGRQMYAEHLTLKEAETKVLLNVDNLNKGIYFVTITNDTRTEQIKLIIE